MTALAITKLDVLSGQDKVLVCTRYRGTDDAEFDHFPYHQSVLHHARGEYEELPGWTEDLGDCRTESDLPTAAREYLAYISEFVGRADRARRRRPRPRRGHLGGRRRRTAPRPSDRDSDAAGSASSTSRSPRRRIRSASPSEASSAETASVIWTETMPSSLQ